LARPQRAPGSARRPACLGDRKESVKEAAMDDRRQMMQDYLEAFAKGADFGQYFTSDVVLTVMGTD